MGEEKIGAIVELLFFAGFVGSLVFYYRFRKLGNMRFVSLSVFIVSVLILFTLLELRNSVALLLGATAFGISVCSGGAMLFFNGWRYTKKQKSEQ